MDILEAIKKRKGGVTKFAREYGLERTNLYKAIKGQGSIKGRITIALFLDTKPSDIWHYKNEYLRERDDAVFFAKRAQRDGRE